MTHKRPRRPSKLVRLGDLARRRGVDERTVRRWVRAGCPVASRGKRGHRAPSFDAAAVAEWLKRGETEERRVVSALISVLDARARRDRNADLRLAREYVQPAAVDAQWRGLVVHVRRRVEAWLEALPGHLLALAAEHHHEAEYRHVEAPELRALLAGPEEARPWPRPADPAIGMLVASGRAIVVLLARGGWHEENAIMFPREGRTAPVPSAPTAIDAAVRELLTELSRYGADGRGKPARSADAPPAIRPSATLRAARAQLADHQARLVGLRDAIASGEVRRYVDVVQAGQGAVSAARAALLALGHRVGTLGFLSVETRAQAEAIARAVRPLVAAALENLERGPVTTGRPAPAPEETPTPEARRPARRERRTQS
jgi:phage terminase Nu1 subunit (DNA packaging protein)